MPKPQKNEKKSDYISRCVSEVMKEGGHTKEQALGKCYGMWDNKKIASQSSVELNDGDELLIYKDE